MRTLGAGGAWDVSPSPGRVCHPSTPNTQEVNSVGRGGGDIARCWGQGPVHLPRVSFSSEHLPDKAASHLASWPLCPPVSKLPISCPRSLSVKGTQELPKTVSVKGQTVNIFRFAGHSLPLLYPFHFDLFVSFLQLFRKVKTTVSPQAISTGHGLDRGVENKAQLQLGVQGLL